MGVRMNEIAPNTTKPTQFESTFLKITRASPKTALRFQVFRSSISEPLREKTSSLSRMGSAGCWFWQRPSTGFRSDRPIKLMENGSIRPRDKRDKITVVASLSPGRIALRIFPSRNDVLFSVIGIVDESDQAPVGLLAPGIFPRPPIQSNHRVGATGRRGVKKEILSRRIRLPAGGLCRIAVYPRIRITSQIRVRIGIRSFPSHHRFVAKILQRKIENLLAARSTAEHIQILAGGLEHGGARRASMAVQRGRAEDQAVRHVLANRSRRDREILLGILAQKRVQVSDHSGRGVLQNPVGGSQPCRMPSVFIHQPGAGAPTSGRIEGRIIRTPGCV